VVRSGEYSTTHRIEYFGGEQYPHLVREKGQADLLDLIARPRAAQ
jgi:hypothetical protein